MTEKEKAAKGYLYNANYDSLLIHERNIAKEACRQYNSMSPLDAEERKSCLKNLFGKTGENLLIEQPFFCDYGYNIEVGENFYMNHNCVILDCAKVTFGNNVFIAPGCGFYTAGHPLDKDLRNSGLEYALPVNIGNDVWIGGNVSVLPGVCIGDNVVIGAGSVVTRDIPAGVIAAGNPCRVIKNITDALPEERLCLCESDSEP